MSERELYSLDTEHALLGALMLDNDAFERIGDRIGTFDFFHGDHRRIYDAIATLIKAGMPADIITVAEYLAEDARLEEVGGLAYLGQLVACVPSTRAATHYADTIHKRRLERDLQAAGAILGDLAHDKAPLPERMDEAQALIQRLTESSIPHDAVAVGELLTDEVEALEHRTENTEALGLSTGLTDLDERLRGLLPGQVVIVAGRPGMGKSVLALGIGLHNALLGKPVAVFTIEMKAKEWVGRAICNLGSVDHDHYRTGTLTQDEYTGVSTAIARLTKAPLMLDDSEVATIEQIRVKCQRLKRKHGLALVVIDYLQLLEGQGENRREQVDHISRQTKRMARELEVSIIAVAQLNRQLEQRTNKRPILADLRESGGLEQDADTVIFLYRDDQYHAESLDSGTIELDIAKQRAGPTGRVRAAWIGQHQAIRDLARGYVPPPPTIRSRKRSTLTREDAS